MGSFNELKKQLTASDVETIMTDMGYNWENDYDDYEEFINTIIFYLNQNKDNTIAVSSETGFITKDALDNPIGIGKNAGKQNKDE